MFVIVGMARLVIVIARLVIGSAWPVIGPMNMAIVVPFGWFPPSGWPENAIGWRAKFRSGRGFRFGLGAFRRRRPLLRHPLPFHLFHIHELINFEIYADHLVLELLPTQLTRNPSRSDVCHRVSPPLDEITVLIIVPIDQGIVLSVNRGGPALEVTEFLAPDICAVFDYVDYLGVEWQASVLLRD